MVAPYPNKPKELVENEHFVEHFDAQETNRRVKQKYYWKKMNEDIR